jgi:hypothetical protein
MLVREPAMAEDFEMEVGSVIKVSFKGKSFFLFAPKTK